MSNIESNRFQPIPSDFSVLQHPTNSSKKIDFDSLIALAHSREESLRQEKNITTRQDPPDTLQDTLQSSNRTTSVFTAVMTGQVNEILLKSDPTHELEPLPEAKEKFEMVLAYLTSDKIAQACVKSASLKILRDRLLTSIFHLNLQPKISTKNQPVYQYLSSKYPYDPVFAHPFPKRPSLEAIEEALSFAKTVLENGSTLFDEGDLDKELMMAQEVVEKLSSWNPYRLFVGVERQPVVRTSAPPAEISKEEMLHHPVESYLKMRQRLFQHGQTASFPEFAHAINGCLQALKSQDICELTKKDPIFRSQVESALMALEEVKGESRDNTAAPVMPYPYRRTFDALRQATALFDMKERLLRGESTNWHEVELSWYGSESKSTPMLLPLYHFNRYKYQEFGLLANPDIILMPWFGDATMDDLLRLRSVPIGLVGVTPTVIRADRHHNSPLDFWYHDINHIRRMWGYDKRRIEDAGIKSWQELTADRVVRQAFMEDLLSKTNPDAPGLSEEERQIRTLERFIIFETFHETALSATRESLLNDLTRAPATRQPFEVQVRKQKEKYLKEKNRQFDGNLKSGADSLGVDLSTPTKIKYFFDRAPGFLSNVYNKLAWGFHESVFEERRDLTKIAYRTPEYLAQAVRALFIHLGYPVAKIPSREALIRDIIDRSGQPELYNYFALRKEEDLSERVIAKAQQVQKYGIELDEILAARLLKACHPELSPSEIAQKVTISQEHKELLAWMGHQLEEYSKRFDKYFNNKLSRCFPKKFTDANDFVKQFVGKEKGKLLLTPPSTEELKAFEKGGTVYVDTWAVPFLNSATQTREQASLGLKQSVAAFQALDLTGPISVHTFCQLLALFARPEFDDVRRYKLQLFPPLDTPYSLERNDAKSIGDRYPDETFIVTNRALTPDDLSFTFGLHIHYLGLIPHSETIRADGRLFSGTADFLEHDQSHGYFSLHPGAPGTPDEWIKIHEEFRALQAQIADEKKRLMNSIIYFQFTHESGYKGLVADSQGNPPDPEAYKNEKDVIIKRLGTENDYDIFKDPAYIGENFMILLDESFEQISRFFKASLEKLSNQPL